MNVSDRLYLSDDLPGIGGQIKVDPIDFEVEEIPLYLPEGDGPHVYVWIEKRGITTQEAIERLARRFAATRRDVGSAGIKDKHALTRQWISMPLFQLNTQDPSQMLGPVDDALEVLQARLHRNKLRTGHLAGNRFRVNIRALACDGPTALERARAILERLTTRGMPNYYGDQRFGIDGQTLALGLGLLSGDDDARRRLRGNAFLTRLAVSAVQSELFNRVLTARMQRDLLGTILDGDVVQKTDTGGTFVTPTDELAHTQGRLERGELTLTGPMLGPKMIAAERDARTFEDEVIAASGFDPALLDSQKRLAQGTRRPLLVPLGDPQVRLASAGENDMIQLEFSLPSGSYATILLQEITRQPAPDVTL